MKIIESEDINTAVLSRSDRRAPLKKLACHYFEMRSKGQADALSGMKYLADMISDVSTIFVSQINGGILLFRGDKWTEESIVEAINKIPTKQEMDSPRKVLLKMCIIRIKGMIKRCSHVKNNGSDRFLAKFIPDKLVISNKEEFFSLQEIMLKATGASFNHAGTRNFVTDVGLFFHRKGIDDELVREAWDLIQVEGVLSE